MNGIQRGLRAVVRKPVKSILLLLVIMVISSFFMAGLASKSASIETQELTRQAVGASFRLETNEENRDKRSKEAIDVIGEQTGEYQGVHVEQLKDGQWKVYMDNSFETLLIDDVEKIAAEEGIEEYNLITAPTVVNPVNFNRMEDPDVDQSSDVGGVNLNGNRNMELDMDVAAGKIEIVDGRMVTNEDSNVCVISEELANLNNLRTGDSLKFNDYRDKKKSTFYTAMIIGIYKRVQSVTPFMSGDSYRPENTIYTDLNFPEKVEGNEGDPLYKYAIFQVGDVTKYDAIKEAIKKVDINWERYDLLDNNGTSENMAVNFGNMEKTSGLLLLVVSVASFMVLFLIFLFWMKNRAQEIGILMALGIHKKSIWLQFLWEALLIGVIAFMLSFMTAPLLAKAASNYLIQQQQTQMEKKTESDKGKVASDYIQPEQEIQSVGIKITGGMVALDGLAIGTLLFLSVSFAGIQIMMKKPKEILSEMS